MALVGPDSQRELYQQLITMFNTYIEPYALVLVVKYGLYEDKNPLEFKGSIMWPFW